MNVTYPFRFDGSGHTALASDDDHILQMIELLLFTNPGERVNRPQFGSGIRQLIFAPNSPELAAALQYTMQSALQQYLGDLIALQNLTVESTEGTLAVQISYIVRGTGTPKTDVITRAVGGLA